MDDIINIDRIGIDEKLIFEMMKLQKKHEWKWIKEHSLYMYR